MICLFVRFHNSSNVYVFFSTVHARDTDGNFYTIIDGGVNVNSETTGLAFSPDNKHMYVSYQG